MAVVARDARHNQAQKRVADQPAWLKRAMNPNTPTTKNNETVRTVDFTMDGASYIAPTLRMGKDGLRRMSADEAINKAIRLGDAMKVPEGISPAEYSKSISDMINTARKHRGRKANRSAETQAR